MMKLIKSILGKMSKVCKSQKKFLLKAFQAFLSADGKMTFSNMCRYVGLSERTFRRQFSKLFCFAEFNLKAIEGVLGNNNRKLAIAFDPFFMSKSGDNTYGKGKFWSGASGRVEKGLEASLISVIDLVQWTGYALAAKQTPSTAELREMSEAGSEITRIDWFLSYIISIIPMFPVGVKILLVDAYFFKEKFITGICIAGLHVVSKMRKDAKLLSLYSGPQKLRGRRKKFDGAINFDELEDIPTDEKDITLRATIAYSVALKRNILVVVVRKTRSDGKIMEAILFSTNTSMAPIDVYQYYRARFQIEFVIRDAKQYAGLTHCQSLAKERIDFHINMSFAAINIAKIKEQERLAGYTKNQSCSIATQHVRYHNEMLIQSIFPILGLDPLEFKSHPAYEQALSYGAVHV
jgi:hypothetical protein